MSIQHLDPAVLARALAGVPFSSGASTDNTIFDQMLQTQQARIDAASGNKTGSKTSAPDTAPATTRQAFEAALFSGFSANTLDLGTPRQDLRASLALNAYYQPRTLDAESINRHIDSLLSATATTSTPESVKQALRQFQATLNASQS